jgi:hypothetical protein
MLGKRRTSSCRVIGISQAFQWGPLVHNRKHLSLVQMVGDGRFGAHLSTSCRSTGATCLILWKPTLLKNQ